MTSISALCCLQTPCFILKLDSRLRWLVRLRLSPCVQFVKSGFVSVSLLLCVALPWAALCCSGTLSSSCHILLIFYFDALPETFQFLVIHFFFPDSDLFFALSSIFLSDSDFYSSILHIVFKVFLYEHSFSMFFSYLINPNPSLPHTHPPKKNL